MCCVWIRLITVYLLCAWELRQNNALLLQFWCLSSALTLWICALDASKSQHVCIILSKFTRQSKYAVINLQMINLLNLEKEASWHKSWYFWSDTWHDQGECVRCWEYWICITGYKRWQILMFYIFWTCRIVDISTTRCLIEIQFRSKCSILNGQVIFIEKNDIEYCQHVAHSPWSRLIWNCTKIFFF